MIFISPPSNWLANLRWIKSIKTLHIIYAMLHSQAHTQTLQTFYAHIKLSSFPKSRGSVLHTAHTSPSWPFLVWGFGLWVIRGGVVVIIGLAITDFEPFIFILFRHFINIRWFLSTLALLFNRGLHNPSRPGEEIESTMQTFYWPGRREIHQQCIHHSAWDCIHTGHQFCH